MSSFARIRGGNYMGGYFSKTKAGNWVERRSRVPSAPDGGWGAVGSLYRPAFLEHLQRTGRWRDADDRPDGYISYRGRPKLPLSNWALFVQQNAPALKGTKFPGATRRDRAAARMLTLSNAYRASGMYVRPKASVRRSEGMKYRFGTYRDYGMDSKRYPMDRAPAPGNNYMGEFIPTPFEMGMADPLPPIAGQKRAASYAQAARRAPSGRFQ